MSSFYKVTGQTQGYVLADNQKEKKTNKAEGFGVIIDNEAKGMAFMKVYKSTLSQAKMVL